jgi:hypothetical protein
MSEKVNNLNDLKVTYNTAKNKYNTALNAYNNALKQLNLNNTGGASGANVYDGANDEVTTKDKVKMKKAGATSSFSNTLDGDVFESTLTHTGATAGGTIYSNQFVQRDLTELTTSDVSLYNTDNPKVVMDANGLTADISSGTCDMTMFNRCDGYAKMENKSYYGLSKNDDGCSCYVFDDLSTNATVKTTDVSVNGGFTAPNEMNYFGIMFDGGLYYLTKENYSDNFKNIYTVDSTKTVFISDDSGNIGLQDTDRNPFTGSGPNTLTITSLGTYGCGTSAT